MDITSQWVANFRTYTNLVKNQSTCSERESQQYLLRRVRSEFEDISC